MTYRVWESIELTEKYLGGVRGAIPLAKEQLDIMVRLIEANKLGVSNFLDIGCGDGILAATVLSKYPLASGTLLDLSENMINAAKERLNKYLDNLTFLELDYSDCDWINKVEGNAPFDVIVSGYSIHHQPDKRKMEIYQEIFSLLAPGGIFINIEHVLSPSRWVEDLFNNYFIDSLYDFEKKQGIQRSREQVAEEFYNRPDYEANILASVDSQCNWLREIGFENVDCYFKVLNLLSLEVESLHNKQGAPSHNKLEIYDVPGPQRKKAPVP